MQKLLFKGATMSSTWFELIPSHAETYPVFYRHHIILRNTLSFCFLLQQTYLPKLRLCSVSKPHNPWSSSTNS